MAIGLMAARNLAERAEALAGRVKVVFQPAEEGLGGARRMVEEGVLDDPPVDACLGLHLWNRLPWGVVAVSAGPIMAAVDRFVLTVRGKGGHAAMPHEGVDAVAVAAHVVTGLQTLFTRKFSPLTPTLLTVGRISGGSAFNVLAETVELEGTVRTFDPATFEVLPGWVERTARGIAESFGAELDVLYERHCPVTENDPGMADFLREVALRAVGPERTFDQERTMGGEDMSYYLRERPGCFFFLGSSNPEEGKDARHHHPRFDIDERALAVGVEMMVRAAEAFLV